MALFTKAGKFTTNTTTGNQAITGLGFQPKLVMFMSIGDQSTTNSSRSYFGAATGSAARFACSQNDKSGVSPTQSMTGFSTTRCLQAFMDGTATVLFDLDFVSMDAGGFTVNNTTAAASGKDVYYLAMGGNDLTAAVGTFNTPTTAIAQSVTGLGFQPNALMIYGGLRSNAAGTDITMGRQNIGMATSSGSDHQVSAAIFETDNVSTTVCNRMWETSTLILTCNGSFTTLDQATFTSFDAGGFTYTTNTASGTSCIQGYIAIKAPRATVWWGSAAVDGSAVAYADDPTTGFQPQAVLLMNNGTTGINGWSHAILNQGWATEISSIDATQSAGLSTCSSNGTTGAQSGAKINSGKIFETGFSTNATTWTDEIVGAMTARNSTTYTITNSTWDGSARQFGQLAIGGTQTINPPTSIGDQSSVSNPTIILGQVLSPTSISDQSGFGSPTLILGQVLSPTSISDQSSVSSPTLILRQVVAPSSIADQAFVPNPQLNLTIYPNTVGDQASVGNPTVILGQVVSPTSISDQAFVPNPQINQGIYPASVGDQGSVSIPTVILGQVVSPASIADQASVSSPTLNLAIYATAIADQAFVPNPSITQTAGGLSVGPASIGPADAWGQPTIVAGPVAISPASIGDQSGLGQPAVTMPGTNAGKHYRKPRTPKPLIYFYRGQEYYGLSALRKAWQQEAADEAPGSTQARAPKKVYNHANLLIEAFSERFRAVPGHIPNPQDAVDDLYNGILALERDLAQAAAREARRQESGLSAQLQQARDEEIRFYLHELQMQALRRDDDQAILTILGAEYPEFLILLGNDT